MIDTKSPVNGFRSFDHFGSFELEMFAAHVLVQPYTTAEQHKREVDKEFVNEAEGDALLLVI
jgi:hypothetical protein